MPGEAREQIGVEGDEREGGPLWRFALRTYGAAGVQAVCLELQDLFGADVDVVLYLAWLGSIGRGVSDQDVAEIAAYVAAWRRYVVAPLRHVRRFLGASPEGFDPASTARLRTEVKRSELEAERLQLDALYRRGRPEDVGAARLPPGAVAENLGAYARALAVEFPEQAVAVVTQAAASSILSGAGI